MQLHEITTWICVAEGFWELEEQNLFSLITSLVLTSAMGVENFLSVWCPCVGESMQMMQLPAMHFPEHGTIISKLEYLRNQWKQGEMFERIENTRPRDTWRF